MVIRQISTIPNNNTFWCSISEPNSAEPYIETNLTLPITKSFEQIDPGVVRLTVYNTSTGNDEYIASLLYNSLTSQGYACRFYSDTSIQVYESTFSYFNSYTEYFISAGHLNLQLCFIKNGSNIFIDNYILCSGLTYFNVSCVRTTRQEAYTYTYTPKAIQLGIGQLPIGKNQAEYIYPTPPMLQILPNSGNQTSTPKLITNNGVVDYTLDEYGNVQGSDPVQENIQLALRTNYNSSSISDFGLAKRKIIPLNYQNIIKQDILIAIQPLIDQGLISDVNIGITKNGSTIFANISYTSSGKKSTYKYGI